MLTRTQKLEQSRAINLTQTHQAVRVTKTFSSVCWSRLFSPKHLKKIPKNFHGIIEWQGLEVTSNPTAKAVSPRAGHTGTCPGRHPLQRMAPAASQQRLSSCGGITCVPAVIYWPLSYHRTLLKKTTAPSS